MDAQTIRSCVRAGKYEFSRHAERERQADKITVEDLEEALSHCKIIEEYPNDPRGPSCLVLGFSEKRPIHAVCAIKTFPEEVFLITVYDPSRSAENWTDKYEKRRE